MNFKVVDEHGRQLGTGRNLAALKAELGGQARGAFQALTTLRVAHAVLDTKKAQKNLQISDENMPESVINNAPKAIKNIANVNQNLFQSEQRYSAWTFGELPELMEIVRGSGRNQQSLIGFPALVDHGDAVGIEVFDEPDVAAAKHRAGLRRLCALQIKDALKYLEKNIPDLQKMSIAFMPLGSAEELKNQIIDTALDKAFLQEPLPTDERAFKQRIEEGRGRLTLIANEVSRLCGMILVEFSSSVRKIKDTKSAPAATADATQQLQRLMPKRFLVSTPYPQLQHFVRYLKAITARLEKHRADPERDAVKLLELRPQEQRFNRLLAERKGVLDTRLQEYRWLLEELRVSFFAQELRTPQPVSVKRLDKVWEQLNL